MRSARGGEMRRTSKEISRPIFQETYGSAEAQKMPMLMAEMHIISGGQSFAPHNASKEPHDGQGGKGIKTSHEQPFNSATGNK